MDFWNKFDSKAICETRDTVEEGDAVDRVSAPGGHLGIAISQLV